MLEQFLNFWLFQIIVHLTERGYIYIGKQRKQRTIDYISMIYRPGRQM